MTTLTVRIPDELGEILEKTAHEQERSKAWLVKKAIQNYLEDLVDYKAGVKSLVNFEKNKQTYTLEEIMKKHRITREELDNTDFDFSDCD